MTKQLGPYEKDWLTHDIIGAAIEVHKEMGQDYWNASMKMRYVWNSQNERFLARQKQIAAMYKGRIVGDLYLDLVVEDKVIVELKSVKELLQIHEAQLIAYLKLAEVKTGLLINFNVLTLKKGIRRISV